MEQQMTLTQADVLSRRFTRAELESMEPVHRGRDYDVLYRDADCELIYDRIRSIAAIMVSRGDMARPGRTVFEPILDYVVR
jgi:hypothetical protein